MIIIAGSGIAGSYLARRLFSSGIDVKLYDPKKPGFRIPCGYATNEVSFRKFAGLAGTDGSEYIQRRADSVILTGNDMPELHFRSTGLCTIDKNRFEADLVSPVGVERSRAPGPGNNDILVDATGISRHYLGIAPDDYTMHTTEYHTGSAGHTGFYFRYFPKGRGYYWEFPLENGFHVGAGSDSQDLIKKSLGNPDHSAVMARDLRLKPLFHRMFQGRVIGVGESIGTVSPITGEGILPSLMCAETLYQTLSHEEDLEEIKISYGSAVRKKFGHYGKLFSLLMDARNGRLARPANITAIPAVKRDFRNFGIDLGIARVLRELLIR
ncbi:MAG: NAD(P)/FAD-dependent oxidoreductase [Thermoplasmataceae archaeon]